LSAANIAKTVVNIVHEVGEEDEEQRGDSQKVEEEEDDIEITD